MGVIGPVYEAVEARKFVVYLLRHYPDWTTRAKIAGRIVQQLLFEENQIASCRGRDFEVELAKRKKRKKKK